MFSKMDDDRTTPTTVTTNNNNNNNNENNDNEKDSQQQSKSLGVKMDPSPSSPPRLVDTSVIHLIPDSCTSTTKTTTTTSTTTPPFYKQLHIDYITQLATKLDMETSYEGAITEHLRVSGVYWSVTALYLLLPLDDDINDRMMFHTKILDWLYTCYDPLSGGFGGNTNQDGHLLYTLSALQIMALIYYKEPDGMNHDKRLQLIKPKIIQFVTNLQNPIDGSFCGDSYGEIDTRFTYCAFSILAILNALPQRCHSSSNDHNDDDNVNNSTSRSINTNKQQQQIDVQKAVQYIIQCRNLDGGFGSCIGAESHAGQVFCCIGALAIAQSLDTLLFVNCNNNNINNSNKIQSNTLEQEQYHGSSNNNTSSDNNDNHNINNNTEVELLSWWLAERQCDSGGLNGRPEKQADVCYSWWILSVLSILGKMKYINEAALGRYILRCQDPDDGGIADRPDDMADVFHTFFGIAGLSLLGYLHPNNNHDTTPSQNQQNHNESTKDFRSIDPLYALPTCVVQKLQLPGQIIARNQYYYDSMNNDNNKEQIVSLKHSIDPRLAQYKVLYLE